MTIEGSNCLVRSREILYPSNFDRPPSDPSQRPLPMLHRLDHVDGSHVPEVTIRDRETRVPKSITDDIHWRALARKPSGVGVPKAMGMDAPFDTGLRRQTPEQVSHIALVDGAPVELAEERLTSPVMPERTTAIDPSREQCRGHGVKAQLP